ncbi:MAG: hypothetical protein Q8L37_06875 [Candidatus Gottesmanbacteria bacterium]|nr:hypothetical protein [Candidatus Gottesmanbacteria bacterium]
MINWNTDEKRLKKNHPEEYKLWRLTQLINYGLEGEKLDEEEVRAAWPKIKDTLAINKRKTLEFLLWNKRWEKPKGLLPDRSNFWSWYAKNRTSGRIFT